MKQLFLALCVLFFVGVSDAAAATLYRSVGTTGGDLKTATSTVGISGTTATFSLPQPDNVGVGDAVVYSGTTYIAFITGRTSSTVFTVQSSTGGTPSGVGGGTSVAIYRCFRSLFDWEAHLTGNVNPSIAAGLRASVFLASLDLVAGGHIMMVPCYGDADDTTSVTLDGWTTGASNYIKIYTPVSSSEVGTSQRAPGQVLTLTGYYRLFGYLDIRDNYVRIDGLWVYQSGNALVVSISNSAGAGEIQISNSFAIAATTTSTFAAFSINNTVGALTVKIWNSIGVNLGTAAGARGFYLNDADITVYCYNCTSKTNGGVGFRRAASTAATLKNCLAYSDAAGAGFTGTFTSVTYSASYDANIPAGTGNRSGQTFSFVETGWDNYHLSPADAGAKEYGTDLSSDGVIPFNTDIDGDTRPVGSYWDIGADEVAPLAYIYRSVGTTATNLNTSNRTVTISGTTATFSGTMPDNVGVGDALVYRTGSIAFISGRTSSTVYTVLDATGRTPNPAEAGTTVYVYRSFTSLQAWKDNTTPNASITPAAVNEKVLLPQVTDMVAFNYVMMVPCYKDGVDTDAESADSGITISSSWVTGPANYIRIYTPVDSSEVGASQRHTGVAGTGYIYRPTLTPGTYSHLLLINTGYVRVEGIELDGINVSSGDQFWGIQVGVMAAPTLTDYRFDSLIIHGLHINGTNAGVVRALEMAPGNAIVTNNIIYDVVSTNTNAGTQVAGFNDWNSEDTMIYYYNNTVYGLQNANGDCVGITQLMSNVYAKNNYVGNISSGGAAQGFFGTYMAGSTNNATYDATANEGNKANGKINQTAYSSYFVNTTSGSEDFHLNPSDISLRDQGVSLTYDTGYSFAVDIDGDSRPMDSTWDIGADESAYVPPVSLYRSVGTTAGSFEVATNVTVSGTTATFTAAQSNNIGVGDAIVYNGSANIAFITGRTSSTVYTVQSATGGAPTAQTNVAVNGIYRCFTSLFNWEANATGNVNTNIPAGLRAGVYLASTDLVTSDYIMMVPCYADGADATAVTIDGWTTGPNNYIKIYTPVGTSEVGTTQRHNGTWGNGYRRSAALIVSDEYVRLDGLSIWQASGARVYFVSGTSGFGDIRISNCFGYFTGGSSWKVFDVYSASPVTVSFWNCIGITNSSDANGFAFYFNEAAATFFCYNCTGIANAAEAFVNYQSNFPVLKNCLGYSTSANAFTGNLIVSYSASNDATADDFGGAGNRINQTFSFVASGSQNYHLQTTDTGARNRGTSLATDTVIPFSTDIDGNSRPVGTAWDIGADETTEPATATLYRSVGTASGDLKTATSTVGISGSTATFNLDQPNNIGVGDAVVYSGTTYIAFISGRTSSKVFTLQNATGGAPTNVASGTSVAVYRSFTSLNAFANNTTANASIAAGLRPSVLMTNEDLVAAAYILNAACYKDGVDTVINDSTNGVYIYNSWVTGPANYIRIYTPVSSLEVGASQRHTGVAGTGYVYRPTLTGYDSEIIAIDCPYVRIEGIELDGVNVDADSLAWGIYAGTSGDPISTYFLFDSLIIHGLTVIGDSSGGLLRAFEIGSGNAVVTNNIVYDLTSTAADENIDIEGFLDWPTTDTTVKYYNNTLYDLQGVNSYIRGFSALMANVYAKNNYVGNMSTGGTAYGFSGTFMAGSTNNASSDDTANDGNLGNGKTNQAAYSNYFVSTTSGSENFHLKATDTALRNAGASLTSDPAGYPFAIDIDGDSRPIGAIWDIGADESPGGSAGGVVLMEF